VKRRTAARVFLVLGFLALGGGLARAHEDLDEQLVHVDAALRTTPNDPALWLERGELHRLHRDFDEARADYAAALARGADPDRVALCHAAALLDEGAARDALRVLRSLESPPDADRWDLLRRAFQALGHPDAAVEAWHRSLALRPTPDGFLDLARRRLQAAPPDTLGALADLHQGLRRCGPAPGLLLTSARLEAAHGAPGTALSTLDGAPEATLQAPGFLDLRAELLLASGRVPEAREAYERLLDVLETLPASRRAAPANASLAQRASRILAGLPEPEPVR